MKISACLIAREPSEQLSRAIASVRPLVDEVVVIFNSTPMGEGDDLCGADDADFYVNCNAAKNCPKDKPCGCKKGDLLDFSALRNASFKLATGDWVVWLDSDDILEFTDPDAFRKLTQGPPHRYRFLYKYTDNPEHDIWTDRLVPRVLSAWRYPIHEIVETPNIDYSKSAEVVWRHRHDPKNDSAARNLRISLHWADHKKYAEDARFFWYLAQSYVVLGQKEKAIESYQKSFAAKLHGSPDEKFVAAEWISRLSIELGKYFEALHWAFQAIETWPGCGNGFLRAGICYYHLGIDCKEQEYFHRSVEYFRIGLTLGLRATDVPSTPNDVLVWEAHKLFNVSLSKIGRTEEALRSAEDALKFRDDGLTRKNMLIYKAFLAKTEILPVVDKLLSCYGDGSEFADGYVKEALAEIGKKLPRGLLDSGPRFEALAPVKKIAIVCGQQWMPWHPNSPPGGSEIAIGELAKRFAKRGYEVSVFTEPLLGEPGVIDGVSWRGTAYSEGNEEFDLVIGWRGLDRVEGARGKRRVLWMHDMDVQHVSPGRLAKVDVVAVNSQWHAEIARPQVPGRRIEVLGAGLDPKRFEIWPKHRNKHHCVWASSWDRGLDFMLEIWPAVRDAFSAGPDRDADYVQLHILYGCEGSLNMARKNNDKAAEERFLKMKALAERTRGVVLHGRVPAEEYDSLLLSAGVWAYPIPASGNTWGETFCVTNCEALCAGLRTVVSPRGALAEVASPYAFRQVFGARESQSYKDAFVAAIISAMTEPEDGAREFLAKEAREKFDWDRVADRWEERIFK